MQLFSKAGSLSATECEQYGLTNRIVAAEELIIQTQKWAETLAQGAQLSQKFGKQIMRKAHESNYCDIFDQKSRIQYACRNSKDNISSIESLFARKSR